MKSFNIALNSILDVKEFVNIVNKCPYDIDLASSRYVVDAKSIMGIFSLDLSKPIKVTVHSEDCDDLVAELKKYTID
ncbi:MAG: HPr family phosphocarrier protein [Clostridia bacterium]|nr:HPr family phosphocarrier protein [Clostridia bacterium]